MDFAIYYLISLISQTVNQYCVYIKLLKHLLTLNLPNVKPLYGGMVYWLKLLPLFAFPVFTLLVMQMDQVQLLCQEGSALHLPFSFITFMDHMAHLN